MFRSPKVLQWVYPNRVWGKDTSTKKIYLTFDDGPIPEVTEWVLDTLIAHEVKATFFCVGSNVEKHPDIYQRILREGHQVGNHTMYHENGFRTNQSAYLNSVRDASSLIDSDLFRPPYGRMKRIQERALLKQGYQIVMWSWLSKDYDHRVTPKQILTAAKSIKGGDILVFHDHQKAFENVRAVLPQLIRDLTEQGFEFKKLKGRSPLT